MTFEERIDRLAERHEALTQSVEMLNRDVQELRATVRDLVVAVQQDGENIRALARIAEIHERRLSDLEGEE
jgi:prefoldin subunit 5